MVSRFTWYVSSADGFKAARSDLLTGVTGLPAWGRLIVLLLAVPGICLITLSLLALLASIATLLLLTLPAWALLRRLADWLGGRRDPRQIDEHVPEPLPARPARRVEATVIE